MDYLSSRKWSITCSANSRIERVTVSGSMLPSWKVQLSADSRLDDYLPSMIEDDCDVGDGTEADEGFIAEGDDRSRKLIKTSDTRRTDEVRYAHDCTIREAPA
jgi:hypothetical protein